VKLIKIGTAIVGHYRNIVVDMAHRPLVVARRYQHSNEFRASRQLGEALDLMNSLRKFQDLGEAIGAPDHQGGKL
jgi:hypothetical protein